MTDPFILNVYVSPCALVLPPLDDEAAPDAGPFAAEGDLAARAARGCYPRWRTTRAKELYLSDCRAEIEDRVL